MKPSNYQLLCLPTFNVLSHTLSQPLMSSTILLLFNTHLDFLHSYLLHYTQLQLPLQQPPHHQFRLLLRCPSSTQLFLQHPQLMDPFGLSLRLVENRNLSTKGIPTPTTSRGPVATYCGDVTLTTKQLERKESVATLQFSPLGISLHPP